MGKDRSMDMDLNAAVTFLTTHGRILERRRMQLLLGEGTAEDVLAALDAYRTADGGYGWGLEPDLRSTTSQPVAAMHALEVLAEARDTKSPRGARAARLAVRPHVPGRRRAVRTALLGHCRECGALGWSPNPRPRSLMMNCRNRRPQGHSGWLVTEPMLLEHPAGRPADLPELPADETEEKPRRWMRSRADVRAGWFLDAGK